MKSTWQISRRFGRLTEMRTRSAADYSITATLSVVSDPLKLEPRYVAQAVKNNPDKFPAGYVFDLSKDEIDSLKSKSLILDEGGRGQHSKRGYKALTARGLYMLATSLKGEAATRATLAIIETYAQVRSMVRDMEVLQSLKDGSVEQATQLTKAGHKLADLIGNNLSTESTKTTIELNLAVLKITHEVTRTKRRK